VCLVYENANGIDGRFKNNWKFEKAKEIHNGVEVDIAAYNEHWLNMQHVCVCVCVLTWAPAREDIFEILGAFEPRCMDPPCLAS
jgi:hypothetical protein